MRKNNLNTFDDQSILDETSSCNHQFFSELITAQKRISLLLQIGYFIYRFKESKHTHTFLFAKMTNVVPFL